MARRTALGESPRSGTERTAAWSAPAAPQQHRPARPPGCRPFNARRESFGAAVNPQLEDVGAVVVARRVEALPLFVQPGRIELGVEDPILVPERASEVGPV